MKKQVKKIIAISGSTRENSTNLNFIKAIAILTESFFEIIPSNKISQLPHFNPDNDNQKVSKEVVDFRKQLADADGILICTPEYAMGVPGTLKNAIDWTVSSSSFSHKPTVLITASLSGEKGHASLLETLKVIEAMITEDTQLVIPFAKTKINESSTITDEKTLQDILKLTKAFDALMTTNATNSIG